MDWRWPAWIDESCSTMSSKKRWTSMFCTWGIVSGEGLGEPGAEAIWPSGWGEGLEG